MGKIGKWIKPNVVLLVKKKSRRSGRVNTMVEKSDAMRQHEKWIEETMKHKPKHKSEGLPVQPWHVLIFVGGLFALAILIGYLIHGRPPV
jgi:hypothetical protein